CWRALGARSSARFARLRRRPPQVCSRKSRAPRGFCRSLGRISLFVGALSARGPRRASRACGGGPAAPLARGPRALGGGGPAAPLARGPRAVRALRRRPPQVCSKGSVLGTEPFSLWPDFVACFARLRRAVLG